MRKRGLVPLGSGAHRMSAMRRMLVSTLQTQREAGTVDELMKPLPRECHRVGRTERWELGGKQCRKGKSTPLLGLTS